jgi:hypothetical protein
LVSRLCPVVSLDSTWAQAWLKLLLHAVAYAGEAAGLTRVSDLWLCNVYELWCTFCCMWWRMQVRGHCSCGHVRM